MRGWWLVSYVFLWGLVLGLATVVVALLRQIGVLHLRLAPTGHLDTREGPALGERAPRLAVLPTGHESLVVFGSEGCGICRDLLPAVATLARSERDMKVVVAAASARFAEWVEPPAVGVADAGAVAAFRIRATPFAVYVDTAGVVRAKGIVNTLEHLESVVERGRQLVEAPNGV